MIEGVVNATITEPDLLTRLREMLDSSDRAESTSVRLV